jgi:hypothetical protein
MAMTMAMTVAMSMVSSIYIIPILAITRAID